jgi:hypothetical protein
MLSKKKKTDPLKFPSASRSSPGNGPGILQTQGARCRYYVTQSPWKNLNQTNLGLDEHTFMPN